MSERPTPLSSATASSPGEVNLHASCVTWLRPEDLDRRRCPDDVRPLQSASVGLLITGPSGSGKSETALRLMAEGAQLVADDRVVIQRTGDRLLAEAPPSLAGLMELRGLGLTDHPFCPVTRLLLQVILVDEKAVERLPEDEEMDYLGLPLPCLRLYPGDPAFIAKVKLALRARARLLLNDTNLRTSTMADTSDTKDTVLPSSAPHDPDRPPTGQPVVLVTGLSGAGRSSALKILEDMGYEAMDNLPLDLMTHALSQGALDRPVALGADPRSRHFSADSLLKQRARLAAHGNSKVTLLFVDCDDEVLQHRFTETRRRHPLATDRPLLDGISAERSLLEPLQQQADFLIDSSRLALADLRRLLAGRLSLDNSPGMQVFVSSFSYRKGLPREADLVFDVRFLKNPHYVEELRPLTGQDKRVADHVAQDPAFSGFFQQLTNLIAPLLPRYAAEGKSYLTVAFGCTGGQHRSVTLAEKMAQWLADQGQSVLLTHREIDPTARAVRATPTPLTPDEKG
ncbi:RNase adapter RapZ [Rhodovibrionaceae bacterium A322]